MINMAGEKRWNSDFGDTFTKGDLSRFVARRTGYMIEDVNAVIGATFDLIKEIISSGNSVHVGEIKIGNKLKRLATFYSKLFDKQIPERYKLYPVLFVSKDITASLKELSESLDVNKEWYMSKQEMINERKEVEEDE